MIFMTFYLYLSEITNYQVYLSTFSFLLFEKYSEIISTFSNQNSLMTHNIALFKSFFGTFLEITLEISRGLEVIDVEETFAPKNFNLEIIMNKR